MSHVPQPRPRGQARHLLTLDTPRAIFVWIVEAREALAILDVVAADATRAPARRKLSRSEARRRYEAARVALAWLNTARLPVEPTTGQQDAPAAVIAASWQGWEV